MSGVDGLRIVRFGVLLAALASVAMSASASAAITYVNQDGAGATSLAGTIDTPTSEVTGGIFDESPLIVGSARPNGVADAAVGSFFPTDGGSFAILTNGDAAFADDPNTNVPDDTVTIDDKSLDLNGGTMTDGPKARGTSDYDASVLRVDLTAPPGANCLTFDVAFLSEEYADYIGQTFNDAFIAELDSSTWTTVGASTIQAPGNFAFDPAGNALSVNSTGSVSMTTASAAGTTYDGATPLLSASKQLAPGPHSLYLSIFDQGDQVVDSAAFVDNLRVGFVADPALNCVPGSRPVLYELDLDQAPEPTRVGTSHRVAATLTEVDGTPVSGEAIDFVVAGANPRTQSAVTDAAGVARLDYSGVATGVDAISACFDADNVAPCEVVGSATHRWTDGTPPETTITSGPDSVTTRDSTPTFEFVSSEPGSRFECRFDGGAFEPCATPLTRELGDGFHDFDVRAADQNGNLDPTPATRHFEIFTGKCAGQKIQIFVNPGQVLVKGTKRRDVILGSPERDVIKSGRGNDVVCDREGDDLLKGGPGNDKLRGGPGDDKILGQTGDDLLSGRSGNDTLLAGPGADFLNGNPGNDVLNGGPDADTCKGGSGQNKIVDC